MPGKAVKTLKIDMYTTENTEMTQQEDEFVPGQTREKRETTYIQKALSYKNVKGFSKIEDIHTKYKWQKKLGEGSFGQVFQAMHIKAQTPVAIKQINKQSLEAEKIYKQLMKQEL